LKKEGEENTTYGVEAKKISNNQFVVINKKLLHPNSKKSIQKDAIEEKYIISHISARNTKPIYEIILFHLCTNGVHPDHSVPYHSRSTKKHSW
jgi:hypothetical protein